MSGIVVGYGNPNEADVRLMMSKIKHRGSYAEGLFQKGRVIMSQNYLRADLSSSQGASPIPASRGNGDSLRICYDGQMGDCRALAKRNSVPEGPLLEERLLLTLYEQFGHTMVQYLDDAIFSFVISDGDDFLAARDLLGIKPLFYGFKNGTLYLASELKSLTEVTSDVYEFPPGHMMDKNGRLTPFAALPKDPPAPWKKTVEEMAEEIRSIVEESLKGKVNFSLPTGSLLSGGLDSSVVTALACRAFRDRFGPDEPFSTFAVGVGGSEDILMARKVAAHCGTEHHELIVDLDQILELLPEVIYYLESFDPSLVRSAVSNFLVSRLARKDGLEVVLSGEGGDEIFCGYSYLKAFPQEELFRRQMECIGYLHNNASLRLDRMNLCHGLRVVAPLISGKLLDYAMRIPPEYKLRIEGEEKIEKWIFRKAFEDLLPKEVVWRTKQEFSQGSGSARLLPRHFERVITDEAFEEARRRYPMIRTKEELAYFRMFIQHFGEGRAVATVGQWIST